MSARAAILGRLGASATSALEAEAARLIDASERPGIDPADPIAAFIARLALPSLGASCERIGTTAEAPAALRRYLEDRGLAPVLYLPPDPVLDALDWGGLTIERTCAIDQVAAVAIARAGVAETGSLVLETAPATPMLPNFLCLHHIVLLGAQSIVPYLEDAILPGAQPRAHYWITGVSGTTDIEGQYVRGAHGPRYLHVVLVDA